MTGLALALICYLVPTPARAQLLQQIWPSTAFAPQAAASASRTPAIAFANAAGFPALCSARFSGTIVAATAQLFNFSIVSEGGVRLWVNDFLVIDAAGNRTGPPARRASFLNVPLAAGVPLPLRLEYSRWGAGGGATLQLWWSGNATAEALVPAAALFPETQPSTPVLTVSLS